MVQEVVADLLEYNSKDGDDDDIVLIDAIMKENSSESVTSDPLSQKQHLVQNAIQNQKKLLEQQIHEIQGKQMEKEEENRPSLMELLDSAVEGPEVITLEDDKPLTEEEIELQNQLEKLKKSASILNLVGNNPSQIPHLTSHVNTRPPPSQDISHNLNQFILGHNRQSSKKADSRNIEKFFDRDIAPPVSTNAPPKKSIQFNLGKPPPPPPPTYKPKKKNKNAPQKVPPLPPATASRKKGEANTNDPWMQTIATILETADEGKSKTSNEVVDLTESIPLPPGEKNEDKIMSDKVQQNATDDSSKKNNIKDSSARDPKTGGQMKGSSRKEKTTDAEFLAPPPAALIDPNLDYLYHPSVVQNSHKQAEMKNRNEKKDQKSDSAKTSENLHVGYLPDTEYGEQPYSELLRDCDGNDKENFTEVLSVTAPKKSVSTEAGVHDETTEKGRGKSKDGKSSKYQSHYRGSRVNDNPSIMDYPVQFGYGSKRTKALRTHLHNDNASTRHESRSAKNTVVVERSPSPEEVEDPAQVLEREKRLKERELKNFERRERESENQERKSRIERREQFDKLVKGRKFHELKSERQNWEEEELSRVKMWEADKKYIPEEVIEKSEKREEDRRDRFEKERAYWLKKEAEEMKRQVQDEMRIKKFGYKGVSNFFILFHIFENYFLII